MSDICPVCTKPLENGKCEQQWYHDLAVSIKGKPGGFPAAINPEDVKPEKRADPVPYEVKKPYTKSK